MISPDRLEAVDAAPSSYRRPGGVNLPGAAVRLWRLTVHHSVLGRPRCVAVITCWTACRESRNSRAMTAGLRSASQAARIGRSCPGVTALARSDAPAVFERPFAAPDGSACRFAPGESCGTSRPRRRASPIAASNSLSRLSSSSRRSDRPRSAGRAKSDFVAG